MTDGVLDRLVLSGIAKEIRTPKGYMGHYPPWLDIVVAKGFLQEAAGIFGEHTLPKRSSKYHGKSVSLWWSIGRSSVGVNLVEKDSED